MPLGPMLERIDIPDLIALARTAGDAILSVYRTDFDVEYKADTSPLTLADQRSHDILYAGLTERYPDIPVLSEESLEIPYAERKDWEYLWLVDPLDGTREFVKKNDAFTINIALVHRHQPILGLLYAPVHQVAYFAKKGSGSFKWTPEMNSPEPLSPTPLPPREGTLTVIGSKSHARPEFLTYLSEKEKEYARVEVITIGSALKFGWVAEGKADIYPRYGPTMEWDTAAGQIILNEVGKKVYRMSPDSEVLETELPYNKENLKNSGFLCM